MRTDQDLIELIKAGDMSAFNEFYKKNWRDLYHIAHHATRCPHEAQDLVQTVFMNFWNNRARLQAELYHPSYLTISLKNCINNLYKKHSSRGRILEQLFSRTEFEPAWHNPVEEKLIAKETASAINAHIDVLPAKMQEVFVLSRQQHLSVREISETLNITPRTVKNQLSNALKILRVKMGLL